MSCGLVALVSQTMWVRVFSLFQVKLPGYLVHFLHKESLRYIAFLLIYRVQLHL